MLGALTRGGIGVSLRSVLLGLFVLIVVAALYVAGAQLRLYGDLESAGEGTEVATPPEVVAERTRTQRRARP